MNALCNMAVNEWNYIPPMQLLKWKNISFKYTSFHSAQENPSTIVSVLPRTSTPPKRQVLKLKCKISNTNSPCRGGVNWRCFWVVAKSVGNTLSVLVIFNRKVNCPM